MAPLCFAQVSEVCVVRPTGCEIMVTTYVVGSNTSLLTTFGRDCTTSNFIVNELGLRTLKADFCCKHSW